MTKKTFLIYKIIAVIAVGVITSISVSHGNWYLPIASLVTAWVLLYVLGGRVKEVMADERDYRIAGKASGWAMRVYSMLSVVIGLILYIAGRGNEVLFTVGSVLLYSAGFLMILYSVLFKIYERKNDHD
jgi:uncharacterized membrane protein